MIPWEIRQMLPEDLEPVVRLWKRSRTDAQPWLEARMNHTEEEDHAHFQSVIAVEHIIWIAAGSGPGSCADTGPESDAVLGFLAQRDKSIGHLYVDPSVQGRGVGSSLLQLAQKNSPEKLELYTHQRNRKTRTFYERRGFRAVAFGISPAPENEPDVRYEWTPD